VLQRLGVTHVLFNRRELPNLEKAGLPIASPVVQHACATQYQDHRYRLCRIDYNGVTEGAVR
jgi:hypothetical protein